MQKGAEEDVCRPNPHARVHLQVRKRFSMKKPSAAVSLCTRAVFRFNVDLWTRRSGESKNALPWIFYTVRALLLFARQHVRLSLNVSSDRSATYIYYLKFLNLFLK